MLLRTRVPFLASERISSILWITIPASVIVAPFILRFSLFPGLFYFFANCSLTLVNILWTLLYANEKSTEKMYMAVILIIEIPIVFLAFIPILAFRMGIDWASWLYGRVNEDTGLKTLISMLQGFVGIYTYGFGSRMRRNLQRKISDSLVNEFRAVGELASIFEIIFAAAISILQAPYEIKWALVPIVLLSPVILAAISLSFGFAFGGSDYKSLIFVGALVTFAISSLIGIMIIEMTTHEGFFTNFSAFGANAMLVSGLVGYFLSDPQCPLTMRIRSNPLRVIMNFVVSAILESIIILTLEYFI